MKQGVLVIFVMFFSTLSLTAASPDLNRMARGFTQDYAEKKGNILFRETLAVLPFADQSKDLASIKAGETVSELLSAELSRSTIFQQVERARIASLVKEVETGMTGLISSESAVKAGNFAGAKLIITGSVAELGDRIQVNARLIETETGKVISVQKIDLPREDIIAESKQRYWSAFESRYGISFSVSQMFMFPADDLSSCMITKVGASYRILRYLKVGIGYGFFRNSGELYSENYTPSGGGITYTFATPIRREYHAEGQGPILSVEGVLPLFRWLHLGLLFEYMPLAVNRVQQDVSDFPVVIVTDNNNDGTPESSVENKRVIVDSIAQEATMPHFFNFSIKVEFLISKRISIYLSGGFLYATDITPEIYEANGNRQWTENIDENGTFSELHNVNFARFGDGSRLKFNFSSGIIALGVAVHI